MNGIFLILKNEKEGRVLQKALQQYGIQVTWSLPNFTNYIKAVQYRPDFILIEIGDKNTELKFADLLTRTSALQNIPMVGFGNYGKDVIDHQMPSSVLKRYLKRPLKLSELTGTMKEYVHQFRKALNSKSAAPGEKAPDESKLLLDNEASGSRKIGIMVNKVDNLLAFPHTIAKILQITANDDASAKSLSKAVQIDPVIAAAVLKFANTVFYASRDRTISDIHQAIVRIGFQETKNIVLSLSIMKLFDREDNNLGFSRVEFWFHSLAVALIAEKLIAGILPTASGMAFMAGLLHDFGVIVLDEFFRDIFIRVMEKTTRRGSCFSSEVKNLLGFSHNEVCEVLFEKWKLPPEFGYCIMNQDNFSEPFEKIKDEQDFITRAVGLANIIAKTFKLGNECDRYAVQVDDLLLRQYQLTAGMSSVFINSICVKLTMYGKFLGLEERTFPSDKPEIENSGLYHVGYCRRTGQIFSPVEHYLYAQKYDVKRVSRESEILSSAFRYNTFIIEARNDDTADSLEPLIKAVKVKLVVPDGPFTIIIICDKQSALRSMKPSKQLRLVPDFFDLRLLDGMITMSAAGESHTAETPDAESQTAETQQNLEELT